MAWRFETNPITQQAELVIDGFENGIADSPHEGIADMRNVNINTNNKQASVSFANAAVTLPPTGFTAVAYTAATTDIFTTASTSGWYAGMALTIVTKTGAGGPTVGMTYYVGDITATTFKLYYGIDIGNVVDITASLSGTFTIYTFGTPTDSVSLPSSVFSGNTATYGKVFKDTFIHTINGLVWRLSSYEYDGLGGLMPVNTLQFLGNVAHSTASSPNTGITVFHGYLLVWQWTRIDYLNLNLLTGSDNPSTEWHYAWKSVSSSSSGHRAVAATDNAVYFCNGTKVGSLLEVAGETFDPANAATFTYNTIALDLPNYDLANCISQLGTNLLVGGILNYVYPWDRISTSFAYPIVLSEEFIKCIVSTDSSAYIFAGNRGIIYITNGSNVDVFKKFPDSLTNTIEPYYNWGWAIYKKNQLFFSINASNNSGTVISNFAGVWALDLDSKALRMTNSPSYGTYEGTTPVIVPMGNIQPTGDGIYSAWLNTTGGIDYTSGSPYVAYEGRIDSDIIPVGTYLGKTTFTNIEFKLAKPLVSGEKVKLSQRSNLTDSFVQIGETTSTGSLSDFYEMNFENVQWLQIRAELSSTATTPSYVPLLEIRIR